MTRGDQLTACKESMNITGSYQDARIGRLLDEVKQMLVDAGASEELVNSDEAIGTICCAVDDLFNYKKLSEYTHMRIVNLGCRKTCRKAET